MSSTALHFATSGRAPTFEDRGRPKVDPDPLPRLRRRTRLQLLLLVFILFIGSLGAARAWGQSCYDPGTICLWKTVNGVRVGPDGSCAKLPTSLYIVDTDTVSNSDGYYGGSGLCGFNIKTGQPCGNYPLSNSVCEGPPAEGGGPAGGGGGLGGLCDPESENYDPSECGPKDDSAGLLGKRPAFAVKRLPLSDSQVVALAHLKTLATGGLPAYVVKAVDALAPASSLHIRARITVTSDETANRPVSGVYEYWEAAGKYHIHVGFPDGVFVAEAPLSDIAYDGHQYQLALPRESMLSVAYIDERAVPLGIPNPFFLALQPLSLSAPDCALCALRLSDLSALHSLRQHAGAVDAKTPPPSNADSTSVKVTLTGSGLPGALDLSRNQGMVVERVDFSDYRAAGVGTLEWPRLVSLKRTVKEDDSDSHLAVTYEIEELQINGPVDDAVFTLDRSPFQRVWAADRRVWLKNPGSTCGKKK